MIKRMGWRIIRWNWEIKDAFAWKHIPAAVFLSTLVSSGYCNKVQRTGWLKTVETYCITCLESRMSKSSCHQGHTFQDKALEETLPHTFLSSFYCHQQPLELFYLASVWVQPSHLPWHDILILCLYTIILEGHGSYCMKIPPCSSVTSS